MEQARSAGIYAACERVTIGVNLNFDWMTKWRDFFFVVRQNQMQITFET